MIDIIEKIGLPAVMEQLAEECSELAQVALKKSRILRGENPTPCTSDDINLKLSEEVADVFNCLDILGYMPVHNEIGLVDIIRKNKLCRWEERLKNYQKTSCVIKQEHENE